MVDKGFRRKLTAILSADAVEYSRLMSENEEATVSTITAYREVLTTLIHQHNGKVLDSPGDNLLAEFVSVVDAVQCAVAVQKEIKARNDEMPENRRMQFRIGINLGDVIQEEKRIYGDGVNIAARLEGLSEPGGICISKTAFDHIESKLPFGYEFLGDQTVKNIAKPVAAYRVLMEPRITVAGEKEKPKIVPFWRRNAILAGCIAFVVVIVVAVIWNFYFRSPPMEIASVQKMAFPLPEKPSIAVLPFNNLSGDPAQDYIADGISENIISALSKISEMFVIASNSTFTYKGKPVKVQDVSEELGVRYVLEGSAQKSGNRVRITAQLIDATTGHHLWSEKYDRDMKDFFALQDEITHKIIVELQVKLTEGEQARVSHKSTTNMEAWSYAVRGLKLFERASKENNAKAMEFFERAVELDPGYVWGWVRLAWTHVMAARAGSPSPSESIEKVVEISKKVLALDESDSDVHALLGLVYLIQNRYEPAIAEGEKSLALGPTNAQAHVLLAVSMNAVGRFDDVIGLVKKAMRLHPYYPAYYLQWLGGAHRMMGRYEDALTAYNQLLDRSRKGEFPSLFAHLFLADVYMEFGKAEEARNHAEEVLRISPGFSLKEVNKVSTFKYKDPTHLERRLNALRKAGIPEDTPTKEQEKPSIAVLPFVNMSSDPEQDFFADGMTDELLTNLSKISGLLVISRNSSFAYKGKTVSIHQVANELKVKYVLEGSIQRAGNRVRIRAQLIDGATDHHLWAESYDAIMENIFDLQDEITKKIAAVLAVKLTVKEQNRIANKETTNIEAYDAFVKGWELLHRETPDDLVQAISSFEEAIELDSMYSRAHAALAWAYLSSSLRFKWQELVEWHNQFRLMARKHLDLAMGNPTSTAHLVASKMSLFRRRYEDSVTHAQLALAFDTNDPDTNLNMAWVLMATGKPEEGLEFVDKTIQLDPRNIAAPLSAAGMAYFIMGDLQQAATMTERAINHNPTITGHYERLSAIYALLGRNQDAQRAYDKSLKTWNAQRFPANLTTIMSSFLIKDPKVAARYADGLVKAGWQEQPSGYYKIYKENRLTGEEVRKLVLGQEITIDEFGRTYWIDHNENSRFKDLSRLQEGKWWVEGDMLCYKLDSHRQDSGSAGNIFPTIKYLNDCGEIYRNPDSLPGSKKQYLYVKDYSIAALTTEE